LAEEPPDHLDPDGVWFVVTFVVAYFARDLNFNFFGWPFSFWVAAQGHWWCTW
jgi:putative solute:sodium symporter small subunit